MLWRDLISTRPDYFLQVKSVTINEQSWKQVRRSRRNAPNLYVVMEYGGEMKEINAIEEGLSPTLSDNQFIIYMTPSAGEMKLKITARHESSVLSDIDIGRLEIALGVLRMKTEDGEVKLDLVTTDDSVSGTITIHCDICDYMRLMEETNMIVSHNAKTSYRLVEVTERTLSLISWQNDLYSSLGDLVMKLDTFVKIIDKISQIHPYADAAWQVAKSFFEAISKQLKADAEVVNLVEDMAITLDCVLEIRSINEKFTRLETVIILVLKQITVCCEFIRDYMGLKFHERMVLVNGYDKILLFRTALTHLRNQFELTTTTNIALIVSHISDEIDMMYLANKLEPIKFDASHMKQCDPSTCHDVVSDIKELLMSTSKNNIIWLHGPHGSGKSTISFTLAEYFNSISMLGAYLHFDDHSHSPGSIIRTIAFKLANFDSSLARTITDNVKRCHGELSVETQFREFLLQPLKEAENTVRGSVIIILDGLNDDVLGLFRKGLFSDIPYNYRFLISDNSENNETIEALPTNPDDTHIVLWDVRDLEDYMVARDHTKVPLGYYVSYNKDAEEGKHRSGPLYDYGRVPWNLMLINIKLKSIVRGQKHLQVLNKHITNLQNTLEENISPYLRAACLSWSDALSSAPYSNASHANLTRFAHEKLLIWIEVMSLIGKYDSIGPALLKAVSWISEHDIQLGIFLQDAYNLAVKYSECISSCAVEVYRSMLQIEKGRSYVADHYQSSVITILQIEEKGYRPFFGHSSYVRSVAFSPDGTRVVSGSDDETVRIWDTSNGNLLSTFEGHTHWVGSVAFSADGSCIISGSSDKSISVWDTKGGSLFSTFKKYSLGICSVAFSVDGSRFVSGLSDRIIRSRDAKGGRLFSTFRTHSRGVCSLALSPDGTRVATGLFDNTVSIWDACNGDILSTLEGHTHWVGTVAFSADGIHVVSGSDDKTVRIWDAKNGNLLVTFEGHERRVTSVAFSSDGTRVVSGSFDNTVRIWDVNQRSTDLKGHKFIERSWTDTSSKLIEPSQDVKDSEWKTGDDGWVKVKGNDHAFWIPKNLRRYVCRPTDDIPGLLKRSGYCMILRVRE